MPRFESGFEPQIEREEERISRSRKKRESTAAQHLGERLAALPPADLAKLDLPLALLDAVAEWRAFPGHEAKRRQMQYIGKLMRELDTDAIRERLDALVAPSRAQTAALHALEKLRDALVAAEGDELDALVAQLCAERPHLKAAHVRHLAQTARQERAAKKPPRAYRELFRILKQT